MNIREDLRHWHDVGDMERTALQETGLVVIPGNTPMVAIMQMADDLGIKHEEIWLAKGFEGLVVNVIQRPETDD